MPALVIASLECPLQGNMLTLIAKRIAILLVTMFVASTVIFILIHAAGDPLDGYLAPGASPEVRAAARERLGLDRPLAEQYVAFLGNTLTGDFGESWRDRQPALTTVLQRLPDTLAVAATALMLATIGGVVLGVTASVSATPALRAFVRSLALLGQAIPAFWLGTITILVFAVRLRWLPSSGSGDATSLVLPAVTLAALPGSVIARLVETSMRDVARSPFAAVARGKGLRARTVWSRHVLPNAMIPALAYIGLQAGFMIGGAVIVESVFAWPGVGRLALQATADRNLPVIHAFVVVVVVLVAIVNIVVDLMTLAIDPRQRATFSAGVANG